MVGFFVAASVVTVLQFLRVKDRRLLLILALFVCLARAHSLEWWDPWKDRFHFAAGFAGLGLLLALGPRHRPEP
ncbi:MAG TPA: hypothetical protein VI669_04190 [Vicinamibacteria bacterium]